MTETPNGPHDPQQQDNRTSPQPWPPPYAGSEWRRPDAADSAAQAGPADSPTATTSPYAWPGQAGAPQAGGAPQGAGAPHPSRAPQPGAAQPGGAADQGSTTGHAATGHAGTGPSVTGPAGGRSGTTGSGATGSGATGYAATGYGATGSGATGYAAAGHGATRYGAPPPGGHVPQAAGGDGPPWPYATPAASTRTGGGRRLVAVAAITAVLGGLAGGGTVALLDSGSTRTVTASGITIDGSSAPASATRSGSVESAAATAMKSVVTLSVRGSQESGTGSGVVIRSDGYILTNEHVTAVADGGGSITVTLADGRSATATLVGADKETDLAVVKVNLTGLTAATFADSDAVKVGQTVVAVGSPLGLDGTVTEGIVSALHRPTSGGSDNSAVIDALQTDAAINPGNSGGALVDLAGRVVGINQSIATAGTSQSPFGQSGEGNIGIGFAIPSDTAARIAQELIATGTATHAYLGVQTQTASSTSGVAVGATLASVQSGGPAAAAGLQAGDVVTKVNDRLIGQSEELVAAIRAYAPGTKVTLTVERGDTTRTVTVTLGSDATQ